MAKTKSPRPSTRSSTALPVLALRDTSLFPHMVMPIVLSDDDAQRLVDDVLAGDKRLLLVPALGETKEGEEPTLAGYGTLSEVLKMLKLPEGGMRILLQGHQRVRLGRVVARSPYMRAESRLLA